jgi:hypothetical protein
MPGRRGLPNEFGFEPLIDGGNTHRCHREPPRFKTRPRMVGVSQIAAQTATLDNRRESLIFQDWVRAALVCGSQKYPSNTTFGEGG